MHSCYLILVGVWENLSLRLAFSVLKGEINVTGVLKIH
jgi:hypothetical protein